MSRGYSQVKILARVHSKRRVSNLCSIKDEPVKTLGIDNHMVHMHNALVSLITNVA